MKIKTNNQNVHKYMEIYINISITAYLSTYWEILDWASPNMDISDFIL